MSHRWHPGRPSIKPSEEDRPAPAPPNGQVIKKTPGPGQSQRESRPAGLAAILPARHQASHHLLESQRALLLLFGLSVGCEHGVVPAFEA